MSFHKQLPSGNVHDFVNMSFPFIMHIDLNSCFAIIEQQANRLLRGKPVGIAAYDTPHGFVIAASYQAKHMGVKLGVNVSQARSLCPGIVIMTPDPAKYREAHRLFKQLLLEYTPEVVPKSIDEFVLNFEHSPIYAVRKQGFQHEITLCEHNQIMRNIAHDIKNKIREKLGEYVTVNVGIATNRFLAKYAAGFHKPDGMKLIDYTNLIESYTNMKLTDLPGINVRYRARLRLSGVYTPIDFLRADVQKLKKEVFKSIVGYYWYVQLRGFDIDIKESSRKTIGHQYALSKKTKDREALEVLLLKLCEKVGRRLRKSNLYAGGIHVYIGFDRHIYDPYSPSENTEQSIGPASFENMSAIPSWHHGEKIQHRLYSTSDIYEAAKKLLTQADIVANVKIMSITVFNLAPWDPVQLGLFDAEGLTKNHERTKFNNTDVTVKSIGARKRTSDAVDAINDRYGEFVITPAAMMDMGGTILDRIAFGQVRDL